MGYTGVYRSVDHSANSRGHGSSLADKARAHEQQEPEPLEETHPEISAGLAMIVSRMMAKRPADRFQDMREVAEALATHVSSSSPSLPSIQRALGRRLAEQQAHAAARVPARVAGASA